MPPTPISPNGAPILHGEGVAAVRKKIEDAFCDVRRTSVERAERAEIEIEIIDDTDLDAMIVENIQITDDSEVIEVEWIEIAEDSDIGTCLRDAEEQQLVVDDPISKAWCISVPLEDATTLFSEALREMGE